MNVKNVNVLKLLNLFDSVDRGASVYLCTISKKAPALDSNANIERGRITLIVEKVLLGGRRDSLILPYSFVPAGGIKMDGLFIWPDLNNIANGDILCVVVPNAEDPTAIKIEGNDLAASKVIVVNGQRDPRVQEMEAICNLYRLEGTRKFIPALKEVIAGSDRAVIDFALQAVVMKVGRTDPDEAVKILKLLAMQCKSVQNVLELEGIIKYIKGKFGHVEPWDQMNRLLCRCLVVLTQSSSCVVKNRAMDALSYGISLFNYCPDFRLQDALSDAERKSFIETIHSELKCNPRNANVNLLNQWVSH